MKMFMPIFNSTILYSGISIGSQTMDTTSSVTRKIQHSQFHLCKQGTSVDIVDIHTLLENTMYKIKLDMINYRQHC